MDYEGFAFTRLSDQLLKQHFMHMTFVCNVYNEQCLYEHEPEHLENEITYQSSCLFCTKEADY